MNMIHLNQLNQDQIPMNINQFDMNMNQLNQSVQQQIQQIQEQIDQLVNNTNISRCEIFTLNNNDCIVLGNVLYSLQPCLPFDSTNPMI
jgi:uncharacterized phage infection (PIP) family protein YhgE